MEVRKIKTIVDITGLDEDQQNGAYAAALADKIRADERLLGFSVSRWNSDNGDNGKRRWKTSITIPKGEDNDGTARRFAVVTDGQIFAKYDSRVEARDAAKALVKAGSTDAADVIGISERPSGRALIEARAEVLRETVVLTADVTRDPLPVQ